MSVNDQPSNPESAADLPEIEGRARADDDPQILDVYYRPAWVIIQAPEDDTEQFIASTECPYLEDRR